jgi:hypothetical protein
LTWKQTYEHGWGIHDGLNNMGEGILMVPISSWLAGLFKSQLEKGL